MLLILSPSLPAAEDEDVWLYPVQPGDDLWKISERFLIDMGYWSELVKLNGIHRPRAMQPGTLVRIPLYWMKVERASVEIVELSGQVTYLPARGEARTLTADVQFQINDGLVVGEGSSILLQFHDGTRTFLGPGTEAYFRRINRFFDSGFGDTTIQIRKGAAETRVPRKGTRFEITTPAANTTVRGTHYRLQLHQSGQATGVEVLGGVVNAANAEGEENLPAGFGTLIAQGKAPEPPVKLLPAPGMEESRQRIRRLPLELHWKVVPGASAYRARLFAGNGGELPLLDRITPRNRLDVTDLADGDYRLSVRAIDERKLEGREGSATFVLDARPFPPLGISPVAGTVVRTRDVRFEWSVPPQAESYHFQLSGSEDFGELHTERVALENTRLVLHELPPGHYFWRVATRVGKETGPWSTAQGFELRPAPEAPSLEAAGDDSTLVLHWRKGKPGQRYRVQMAEDPDFSEALVEKVLDQAQWSLPRPSTPVHFRVRVIDTDGYEGPWSPVQKVFPPPEPWYRFGIPAVLIMLLAL